MSSTPGRRRGRADHPFGVTAASRGWATIANGSVEVATTSVSAPQVSRRRRVARGRADCGRGGGHPGDHRDGLGGREQPDTGRPHGGRDLEDSVRVGVCGRRCVHLVAPASESAWAACCRGWVSVRVTSLNASGAPLAYTIGMVVWAGYIVYVGYLYLCFPRGRLESTLERGFILAFVLSAVVVWGLILLLSPTLPAGGDFTNCGTACPHNALQIVSGHADTRRGAHSRPPTSSSRSRRSAWRCWSSIRPGPRRICVAGR